MGAEPFALAEINLARVMHASDHVNALSRQTGQDAVFTEGAIAQQNVSLFERFPQAAQQTDIVVMKVAGGQIDNGAAGQGKERHKLEQWKSTARLLALGLGILLLVGRGV